MFVFVLIHVIHMSMKWEIKRFLKPVPNNTSIGNVIYVKQLKTLLIYLTPEGFIVNQYFDKDRRKI